FAARWRAPVWAPRRGQWRPLTWRRRLPRWLPQPGWGSWLLWPPRREDRGRMAARPATTVLPPAVRERNEKTSTASPPEALAKHNTGLRPAAQDRRISSRSALAHPFRGTRQEFRRMEDSSKVHLGRGHDVIQSRPNRC